MTIPNLREPPDSTALPCYPAHLLAITPVYMAGADQNTAELRPASFRGALRYWFRALYGGCYGNDLAGLKAAESAVFGSTDIGSPLVLELDVLRRSQPTREDALIHTDNRNANLWRIDKADFKLKLGMRPGTDAPPDLAKTSVKFLANLGSIGRRSRRGFGSLQLIELGDNREPWPEDSADLVEHLTEMLASEAQPCQDITFDPFPGGLPTYPILHPEYCKIAVCTQPSHRYEDAMRIVWQVLRSNPYRDEPEFGAIPNRRQNTKRRASPLWLRIAQCRDRQFYPVLTIFKARLWSGRDGDWSLAQDFLNDVIRGRGQLIYGGGTTW